MLFGAFTIATIAFFVIFGYRPVDNSSYPAPKKLPVVVKAFNPIKEIASFFTKKNLADIQKQTLLKEPELTVKEVNPETNPENFYLKDEKTGEFDKLYEKTETSAGINIKSKSATEAGFQQLVIEGDTTKLYDGTKQVAKGQIILQTKGEDGVWKEVEEQTATPVSEPTPIIPSTPSDTPASEPTAEPTPSPTPTPFSFLRNIFQPAKAQEATPVPSATEIQSPNQENSTTSKVAEFAVSKDETEKIKEEKSDKVVVEGKTEFSTGDVITNNVEIASVGEGKDTAISQKQTFKTGALSTSSGQAALQRLVWEVKLTDYDIKQDQKFEIPSTKSETISNDTNGENLKRKEYGSTVIDCSDFTGDIKWVEDAKTDTVTIYFDEEGTTEAIEIDPILTVTEPASQIVVTDGTRTWKFDTSVAGAPKYYYDTHIGGGADNLASTNSATQFIGPGLRVAGALSGVTQTLVENTPTRVKIRTTGNYATSPTTVDNYYTIYPDGRAFLSYSGTVAGSLINLKGISTHYLNAGWQVSDHDDTNHTFVISDTSNSNYPGLSVVPFTNSEFGGTGSWSTTSSVVADYYVWQKTPADGTYTGNMAIDFSNYRATTTTRDALMNEYRTPAALANFVKGTAAGDGFNEAEGAYTITADASGDAKFDLTVGASTRIKPVFTIADATRAEDSYQVLIGGAFKTKGIDYNLSKPTATTLTVQLLASYAADITDLEISSGTTTTKIWDGGGADNNWSTQENWTDDVVPGAADNVLFGSTNTKACTVDAGSTPTVASLTVGSGYSGTITVAKNMTVSGDFSLEDGTFNTATFTINVTKNFNRVGGTLSGAGAITVTGVAGTTTVVNFGNGGTITWTGILNLNPPATATINLTMGTLTTSGTCGGITIAGTTTGAVVLQDALTMGATKTLTLTSGTLNTNGQAVSVGRLVATGAVTRTLTLGSSAIILTGTVVVWDFGSGGASLTFNANTSTITFTGSAQTLYGGAKSFNNVIFSGGIGNIAYNNTFANLTVTGLASKTDIFNIGSTYTQTISGTLTFTGNSVTNRLLVYGVTLGDDTVFNAAAVVLSNVDFRDITFAGTMTVTSADSIGDCGGNSGTNWASIVTAADTETWNGSTAAWSSSNWVGGTVSRVPLPQDNVVLAGTNVVTADMPRLGKDISFSGAARLTLGIDVTSYGSLDFTNAGTFSNGGRRWIFESQARAGTQTLTSNSYAFYRMTVYVVGATLQLLDNLTFTSGGELDIWKGTFDANNYNVSVPVVSFSGVNSGTRGILMGSGTWTLSGQSPWLSNASNLTFNAGTSTISLTYSGVGNRIFGGVGLTYYNLSISGGGTGVLTIADANTFNNFTIGAPKTVTFPSTVTTTINGTFTANGTSSNLITLNASTPGSAATISHAGNIGTMWNGIQDITSNGGGTWNASFSTNVSGNTGITFSSFIRLANGGGNFSAGATWDGGVVPVATDDIYADASSGQLTITATAKCRSFDFTGYTGVLTETLGHFQVYGDAGGGSINRFGAAMTFSGWGTTWAGYKIIFNAGGSTSITSDLYTNGATINALLQVQATGAGAVNLRDNLATGSTYGFSVYSGTFNTNNFAMNIGNFNSSGTVARTINLGSSAVTVTGANTAVWDFATATGLTFNAGTSSITFTGAVPTLSTGGKAFNNVIISSTASNAVVAYGGSFNNLTVTGTATTTDSFQINASIAVSGTFAVNGNSLINRLLVKSGTLGTPIVLTAAAVVLSNVDFRDITFAGVMDVTSASSIGDCGGNSGVNWASIVTAAVDQHWISATGGNWSDNTKWTSRVPLPQDDVYFDNAFSASQTVTADMPRLGKSIDWTGATGTPIWNADVSGNVKTIYGSLTCISNMSINVMPVITFENRNSANIRSSGKQFYDIQISMVGGTLNAQDDLNVYRNFSLNNGTFDANGFNVTVSGSSGGVRSLAGTILNMGSGTWTVSGSIAATLWNNSAGGTINASTSTIILSDTGANNKTFAGGGLTYNNLVITGGGAGAWIFTGANTFNNFTIGAPKVVTFPSGVTTTINGTFTANGVAQPTKIINGGTLNGNLETWTTPTNAADWTEVPTGTSTVNQETDLANVNSGSNACRLDISVAGNSVRVRQGGLTIGKRYKATVYAKVSSGTPLLRIGTGTAYNSFTLSTTYTKYTSYFTANEGYLYIGNGSGISYSIYLDDVTLEESNDIEINASTPGSAATLSKASGIVALNYAGVKDTTVTGGAKWYLSATSTDISGNTGWLVDATVPTDPTVTTLTVNGDPVSSTGWTSTSGSVLANFSGATDPDSGLAGYYTYFGTNAAADPVTYQAHVADPQTFSTPITTADDGKHFYFRVKTKDAVGNVGAAVTLFDFGYDITLPTRPTFVAADPPGYTTVNSYDFSWPAGTDPNGPGGGASGIKWYEYKRANDIAWSHTADAATRTVAGITAYQEGANAFYVRTIDNATNTSSNYQQVTYYFSGVAPAKPTNIAITPDPSATNDLTITWDKSAVGVGDPPVVGYYYSINAAPTINNVTYVASSADHVSMGPDHFATLQGLNTIYILGKNAAGNYSFEDAYVASATFTCQTPAPPAPVEVTISDSSNRAYSTYSLTIAWSAAPGQDPATFDHYAIERSLDGVTFLPLATTGNSTAYIDVSGLLNTTIYYYQIKAVDNANSESAASSIVFKQPIGNYQLAPTILANPTVGSITSQSATIAWTTDRVTSSIVRYGLVDGTWTGSSGQFDSVTDHSVILTGLKPASRYYFQVQSLDEFYDYDPETAYSSTYNLTTTAAPAISAVTISNITLTSVDINFETTTISTVTVNYGLTNTYGTSIEDLSGAGTTKHTVKLTGLETGTTYYFQITGLDDQGLPLTSDGYQFDTLALPRIDNLAIQAITDRAAPAFKANWTTNVMTTTILRYRVLGGSDYKEIIDDELKLEHEVEVADLAESTTYEVVAAGRDSIGNLAESSVTQYMTPKDSRPPQISDITIETFMVRSGTNLKAQISVSWKTDEPASSQVDYGVGSTGALTQSTTEETGLATQRSVIISDLVPATVYHLKVIAKDAAGNTTESESQMFVTSEGKKSAWDLIRDVLMNVFGFLLKKYE